MKIYIVLCSTGKPHPQEFQAGRPKFGAYDSRKDAELDRKRFNRYHPGHRVVPVVVPKS